MWEKRKADRLLRKLEMFESFATSSEGPPDAVRIACAKRYRELIGVTPDSRNVLRDRLRTLKAGETVANIVLEIRSDYY